MWSGSYYIGNFVGPTVSGFLPQNVFDKFMGIRYAPKYVNHICVDEDGSSINNYLDHVKMACFNPFSFSPAPFHLYLTFNENIEMKKSYI